MRGTSGPQLADAQNTQIQTVSVLTGKQSMAPRNGGYLGPGPVYAAPDQDVCGVDM